MSESTRYGHLDIGYLIVRVAMASAIVFLVILLFHFFWILGLLAVVPASAFLFFYLKWAVQQIPYADDNVKRTNLVRKGEVTDTIETVERPAMERQVAVIGQAESQIELKASTTSNLPSPKYCGFCGKLMPATYTFCPTCGKAQIETAATRIEVKTTPPQKSHRPMRTIAIAVVMVLVLIGAASLLYVLSIGLIGSPPAQGGSPLSQGVAQQVILWSYNFPIGGPLSLKLENVGSSMEDLANAQYLVCAWTNGQEAPCVQGAFSGTCGTAVAPGVTCQAIVTVSMTSVGPTCCNNLYGVKIVTPSAGVFSYNIYYGGSGP